MNREVVYEEFCTGCGLCKSVLNAKEFKDDKRFPKFKIDKDNIEFFSNVCPAAGESAKLNNSIWGGYKNYYYGYSKNDVIRHQASSGGILTSIAMYLIKSKKVDAIIHVQRGDEKPYETTIKLSRTEDDVLQHSGSRYAISSPLTSIKQIIKQDNTYAFIGKPCDVSALRMYMQKYNDLQNIKYLFSFFCAGTPSEEAQHSLLCKLGCNDISDCKKLDYRGNGWPGYTTCSFYDGRQTQLSYVESWGTILGRDIRNSCKFCFDGIGLLADISCCDAWHLSDDMQPNFKEAAGRNAIFARNEVGQKLLDEMVRKGEIYLEKGDINKLRYIQEYQYVRRATMIDKMLVFSIFNRNKPYYPIKTMIKLSGNVSFRKHLSIFKGTCQRIIAGRI